MSITRRINFQGKGRDIVYGHTKEMIPLMISSARFKYLRKSTESKFDILMNQASVFVSKFIYFLVNNVLEETCTPIIFYLSFRAIQRHFSKNPQYFSVAVYETFPDSFPTSIVPNGLSIMVVLTNTFKTTPRISIITCIEDAQDQY